MQIGIKKVGGKWSVFIAFKTGQQFHLAPCENEEEAFWMAEQLEIALTTNLNLDAEKPKKEE